MQQNPVFEWGKAFVDTLDLGEAQTILDVGCRTGNVTAYLSNRYKSKQFTAIDNIKTEIEQAKTHQLPNLAFERMDALNIEFTETFDAVISLSCLHWISNKYQILKNIYRALKPGGKAYLQFFALHGRPKNDRFIYQTAQSSDWKYYFPHCHPTYHEITAGEFALLAQKSGLVIHKFEFNQYNTPFIHADSLQDWLSTWASQANYIPKQKRDHFLNDIVHRYLDHHYRTYDTPFPYYEYLLEVICEKPNVPLQLEDTNPTKLTKREQEILKIYLHGKTAKEIAEVCAVSTKTVEYHLASIKKKLKCHRRSDIHQVILSQGLIHLFL